MNELSRLRGSAAFLQQIKNIGNGVPGDEAAAGMAFTSVQNLPAVRRMRHATSSYIQQNIAVDQNFHGLLLSYLFKR